jgi:hypothetical protein
MNYFFQAEAGASGVPDAKQLRRAGLVRRGVFDYCI